MAYCTVEQVKEAIDFPSDGAPISDTAINGFILDAEEEIENIYKTKFGDIGDNGVANGTFSSTTFSDSTKQWETNQWVGYVIWIYGGTGSGQYSEIQSNDDTTLTFNAVATVPDSTSKYRIVKLGYKEETIDGTGTNEMFVNQQPLINVNSLVIDSTSVTPSNIYQYKDSGRLKLKSNAEVQFFSNREPQLVELKYIYGVYPLPRIIQRLAVCIAGIRTLTAQIAGTYDAFSSVTLPGGFSGNKGEPYTNIRSSLDYLQGEAKGIVYGTKSAGQVSGNFRTEASYRPFALFG